MHLVRQTEEFIAWLDALRDVRAQARIAARIRQVETGILGDWKTIEGSVCEFRVHYGPGYRLYFTRRGRVLIILLAGGDKTTQRRDVKRALKLESLLGDDV